jgi:hypothetical protein
MIYVAFILVALVSAVTSILFATIAFTKLGQISDSGMGSIAAMVAAPAVMGISISFFVFLASRQRRA